MSHLVARAGLQTPNDQVQQASKRLLHARSNRKKKRPPSTLPDRMIAGEKGEMGHVRIRAIVVDHGKTVQSGQWCIPPCINGAKA
jgi:hypothetical protein